MYKRKFVAIVIQRQFLQVYLATICISSVPSRLTYFIILCFTYIQIMHQTLRDEGVYTLEMLSYLGILNMSIVNVRNSIMSMNFQLRFSFFLIKFNFFQQDFLLIVNILITFFLMWQHRNIIRINIKYNRYGNISWYIITLCRNI